MNLKHLKNHCNWCGVTNKPLKVYKKTAYFDFLACSDCIQDMLILDLEDKQPMSNIESNLIALVCLSIFALFCLVLVKVIL
jgi:hypothetical protein